ncbi:MAG: InlB B-repeat-containing protein [Clostridia bacterium]|nr:InlB B-repeat-containing protein [Clostridia bacterium]
MKKIVSLMLCLAMIISANVSVFATDDSFTLDTIIEEVSEEELFCEEEAEPETGALTYSVTCVPGKDGVSDDEVSLYAAQGSVATPGSPVIFVVDTTGKTGSTVLLDINLSNNPGIALVSFYVHYDSEAMTLKNATLGEIFTGELDCNFNPVPFVFNVFSGAGDKTNSGKLVTLEFEIAEDCPEGEYEISLTDLESINIDEENVHFDIENGKIVITNVIPGDVNGDGEVTRMDLLRLAKHFSGFEVVIDEAAANVNGDDSVTRMDLLRLAKHFSGFDVELESSIPECTHTNLKEVSEEEASCTEDGNIAYWKCKCGKLFADSEATEEIKLEDTIVPAGHTPGEEATCTEAQVCTECGEVLEESNGHTPSEAVRENEVEKTCKVEGTYDEVVYCSECGEEMSRTHKSEGYGEHTPGEGATCTESQVCTECGEVLETADGHIPGAEATCVAPQICTVCDTVIVEATGEHKETTVPGVEATYTSKGLTEGKKCSVCDTTLKEQEEIDYLKRSVVLKNTKSNEGNQTIYYYQFEGVLDLPELSGVNGYSFDGWYTKSSGGELVDYIPKGTTSGYDVLYAQWNPIEYTIIYEDAPKNTNLTTYTIENEIILVDPEWPGLTFSHWTDQGGNVIEKIEKGTTGTIALQAHYKSRKNIVIPSESEDVITLYDEKNGQYHFVYKLGTISNILLKEYQPYIHNTPAEYNYTVSESVTIEENIANTVAQTVGVSITSTEEWSDSVEWAKSHSEQNETGMVICPEFEVLGIKAKLFEYSDSTTVFDEESLTETSVVCKADSSTAENSYEINSTISYANGYTQTVEKSWKIDPTLVPYGKYTIASVCDANVFAIVTYDPKKSNYYLDTFTIINSVGDTMLYDPSGYSDVDIVENPGLSFEIPKEKIESAVESSYYVAYEANGGTGNMFMSVHSVNQDEKLSENLFIKPGYTFTGWKCETEAGVTIYEDNAVVKNLADNGEIVTLYAQWQLVPYTAKWSVPANATITVKRTSSPNAKAPTGTLSSGATVYYGDVLSVTYSANTGYTLSSKGSTSIVVTGNVNSSQIYASATANAYTVTYNANGGTGTMAQSKHTYNVSAKLSANGFSRTNYTFLGWSTSASATTPTYTNQQYVSNLTSANNGNVTLYAVWVKTTATIVMGEHEKVRHNNIGTANDTILPGMNRQALLDNGYTKLNVTVIAEGRGTTIIAGHKIRLTVFSNKNEQLHYIWLGNYDGSWGAFLEKETSFTIDLVNKETGAFNTDDGGGFWVSWTNAGNDGYALARTVYTITASK